MTERITEAAGAPPRRLHPDEDIHLTCLAATTGAADPRTPVVLLRLGAAQLQLALGRNGHRLWTTQAELGLDDLIRSLEIDEGLTETTAGAFASLIRERLRVVAAPLHHRSPVWRLVASGTTARDLAAAIVTARRADVPATTHETTLSFRELLDASTRFQPDGSLLGTRAPGLPMNRGDEPPVGARLAVSAALIAEVADALWIDSITVSGWGAREGEVLESLTAVREPDPVQTARRRSVIDLAETLASDLAHTEHTARLAASLFDGTASLHRLTGHDRELLEHAARLHDVAARISPAARHRLGGAFLENAALPGFSTDDRSALACLVRFHKGAGPSHAFRPYQRLPRQRRRAVAQLTALLRVADGLDRGHDGAVTDVDSQLDRDVVRLVIDGADLEMARWGATTAAPFFRRTFDRELQIIKRPAQPIVAGPLLARENRARSQHCRPSARRIPPDNPQASHRHRELRSRVPELRHGIGTGCCSTRHCLTSLP